MTIRLALAAVSYDLNGAVEATGIGQTRIKQAAAAGELVAHYNGVKQVFLATDLVEWIESLPTEKPAR